MVVEDKERNRLMRTECAACGNTFAVHGAELPHTRGDECSGFTASDEVMALLRRWEEHRALRLASG